MFCNYPRCVPADGARGSGDGRGSGAATHFSTLAGARGAVLGGPAERWRAVPSPQACPPSWAVPAPWGRRPAARASCSVKGCSVTRASPRHRSWDVSRVASCGLSGLHGGRGPAVGSDGAAGAHRGLALGPHLAAAWAAAAPGPAGVRERVPAASRARVGDLAGGAGPSLGSCTLRPRAHHGLGCSRSWGSADHAASGSAGLGRPEVRPSHPLPRSHLGSSPCVSQAVQRRGGEGGPLPIRGRGVDLRGGVGGPDVFSGACVIPTRLSAVGCAHSNTERVSRTVPGFPGPWVEWAASCEWTEWEGVPSPQPPHCSVICGHTAPTRHFPGGGAETLPTGAVHRAEAAATHGLFWNRELSHTQARPPPECAGSASGLRSGPCSPSSPEGRRGGWRSQLIKRLQEPLPVAGPRWGQAG